MSKKEITRGAGILLPISSLPSSYGIGTLGEAAYRFVDLLIDLKQKYWQVLPIGPTSFGDSPYQSFSLFAGNPYLIDLDILVKDKLLSVNEIKSYHWGSSEDNIDYAILYENRYSILQAAYSHFSCEDQPFKTFCETQRFWLEGYSFFMALKTFSQNKEWLLWEPKLKDRDETALEEKKIALKEEILFWKFCQYKFFQQWDALKEYANKKGVLIIGDIPLYAALDSADVWEHRELFQLKRDGRPDYVAGSPPDYFSTTGQKWGNPLYRWDKIEETDFHWWKKRMEANAKRYDMIRFDHFIGMIRYYCIPIEEKDATIGYWEKGPGKKLTHIIEGVLGSGKVIAHDLGVTTPAVKKLIHKIGWPEMKVLEFAFDGNTDHEYLPHNFIDNNIVVYGGTHDNETLVGFFRDKTEYELAFLYEYLNITNKEEIPDAIIRLGYGSIANIVIFQMQDLLKLGNEARMNLPSTVGVNWKWRYFEQPLDEQRRSWIRTMVTIFRR